MLLTCVTFRAIHLELIPTLTTDSVRSLQIFISRRGVPNVIYSDNTKTSKPTSYKLKVLTRNLETDAIQNVCTKYRIEWRFIVERVLWWGGFWEKVIIKKIKTALKLTLERAC